MIKLQNCKLKNFFFQFYVVLTQAWNLSQVSVLTLQRPLFTESVFLDARI